MTKPHPAHLAFTVLLVLLAGPALAANPDAFWAFVAKHDVRLFELAKKRLRGTPGTMRRPTAFEKAAAGAYGLPAASLSAFPNGAQARKTVLGSFMGAVSDEMTKVGEEAIDQPAIARARLRQHLDRDPAGEGLMDRLIDHTHPPLAELAHEAVGTDLI